MAAVIESRIATASSINSTIQEQVPVHDVHTDTHKKPPRQSCKITYRFRRVSSRGALMILFWVFLVSTASGPINLNHDPLVKLILGNESHTLTLTFQHINYILPTIVWLITAIVSAWIAESKLGNYKTVKLGLFILFVAAVLDCTVTLSHILSEGDKNSPWYIAVETIPKCLKYIGNAMVTVSSLQLALDQMPDASSANITSFIVWFVFSSTGGNWIYQLTSAIPRKCLQVDKKYTYNYEPAQYLLPVACLSIALCTDFFLSSKWLTKLSASPQQFTKIYHVLKFAAKHKAPLNRSAFTYWEEDIPSRIDLGKSRYGGPFTTEQVENVKTALSMLKMSLPFSLIVISFYLFGDTLKYFEKTHEANVTDYFKFPPTPCSRVSIQKTFTSNLWWVLFCLVTYEFTVYPFIVKWVPTSLKRVGIGATVLFFSACISLVLSGVSYSHKNKISVDILWIELPYSIVSAQIMVLLYTAILEFVCAQSPHNLRGFVIGYMWCTYSISGIVATVILSVMFKMCDKDKINYRMLIYCAIVTVIALVGLLLFCILSNRYKKRVREETHTPQVWAEDVYGRYLGSDAQRQY